MSNFRQILQRATVARSIRLGAAVGLMSALSGCLSALTNYGDPPKMSPIASARKPLDPSLPRPAFDKTSYYLARAGKSPGIPKPRGARHSIAYPGRAPDAPRSPIGSPSLFRGGLSPISTASLYADKRARSVGDPLTVIIEIAESSSVTAKSSRDRSTSTSIGAPTVFGLEKLVDRIIPGKTIGLLAGATATGETSQTGTGSTERDESVSARVAATVVEVLPNGHLVIVGSQEVRVNYELRNVQIVGVVRPRDISPDNTITHDRVASARISIGGDGPAYKSTGETHGERIVRVLRPF
ncbi:MAG: flagellar basal body L-ring protein FlgH [Neomegalonema sp.]|nr:flagellar basal body L-ring protein FlgH [Neomegalonema sp.]